MKFFISAMLCSFLLSAFAQNEQRDSTLKLDEVTVKAYFSDQPLLRSPATVSILDSRQLGNHSSASLVTAINTVAGVRMEERSPGSYRLSIRGSLLRSPFGIRNVKMYLDDFPITDASGNTYLNLLDAGGVNRIEILKGPEASVFGANSGGVVLINQFSRIDQRAGFSVGINGGSYGLLQQNANAKIPLGKYQINISQAYQKSEGYRENSALDRKYLNIGQQWQYAASSRFKALILYSDLHYQTPGGLTEAQVLQNPRSARLAAGRIPGAVEQQAGIFNTTLFGGLSHEVALAGNIRHVVSVFASGTEFKNPFITNFEERDEKSAGIRTFLELKGASKANWQWQTGLESQQTNSDIDNFGNSLGNKTTLLAADKLVANQSFIFSHYSIQLKPRVLFEAAASINFYKYQYKSLSPVETTERTKRFNARIMPRLAVSYGITDNFWLRASVSRGYSAPTIAEVRASDNFINTGLQPEYGWNYETGLRFSGMGNRVTADVAIFEFRLQDAIVRRLNPNDTEYFVNAGGTKQRGLEFQAAVWLIDQKNMGFLRGMQFRNSYAISRFSFNDYKNAATDFSGNRLTGVPRHVLVNSILVQLPLRLNVYVESNYTSSIPLNDANSVFSKAYNLINAKITWQFSRFSVNAGAMNISDISYSLGNDLNAVGNRYFNPAAGRNLYAGLAYTWNQR